MKKDLLYNVLAKLTEQELKLVIGVCQFVIETLEKCLLAKHLEEKEEE